MYSESSERRAKKGGDEAVVARTSVAWGRFVSAEPPVRESEEEESEEERRRRGRTNTRGGAGEQRSEDDDDDGDDDDDDDDDDARGAGTRALNDERPDDELARARHARRRCHRSSPKRTARARDRTPAAAPGPSARSSPSSNLPSPLRTRRPRPCATLRPRAPVRRKSDGARFDRRATREPTRENERAVTANNPPAR